MNSPAAGLGWYARRLRSMSPGEIALHLRRAAAHRRDAVVWKAVRPAWRRSWEPGTERVLSRLLAPTAPMLLGASRVEDVRTSLAGAETEIVAEAERRLVGRVTVLGHPEFTLGPERVFDQDPVSGTMWPDRHGRLIDYRRAEPGDPRVVWELERCQELPLLVLASLLTGDPRFADAAAARLRLWLASHPPGRGIAWANAFEPGIRALSLAITFDALRSHVSISDDAGSDIARGLWQHGRWIVRDRSRYSSANNHLVGELTGLLAIATLVPELHHSESWRKLAIGELSREARLQVLPDGSSAEQAFAYGLFTTDLFLACAALLETAGLACPAPIVAALSRTADALALLVDIGESEPAFGDNDNGRALVLDGARDRTSHGVAAGLATFLGHPGARRLAGFIDPTAALLFGRHGLTRFEAAAPGAPPGDGILPDGGLVVLRRAGVRALFDVGPLGYLSIAAHGHADALQLVVSMGADDLVSDPGTGSYLGDSAVRRRLRGTAAHAAVCVDGGDQSQQGGPFLWIRHARARLLNCDFDGGIAVAEHDGYRALPDPVTHRRAVIVQDDGSILVVDRLGGASEHTYQQTWPLHPTLKPDKHEEVAGVVVATRLDGPGIVFVLVATGDSKVLIENDGLWSRRLEQSDPAWVVSQRVTTCGPADIAALLVPITQNALVALPTLELERDGNACLARVRVGGDERRLRIELGGAAPSVQRQL